MKVTVTEHGDLDTVARFFTAGDGDKLVYCPTGTVGRARARLGRVATVVDGGHRVDVRRLSEDLHARGVRRLMVEGGGSVHTQFLTADLVDELHLVVAPFFVGDPRARRFVGDGSFPWNPGRRATLADVRRIGDVVLTALRPLAPVPDGLTGHGSGTRTNLGRYSSGLRCTAPVSASLRL